MVSQQGRNEVYVFLSPSRCCPPSSFCCLYRFFGQQFFFTGAVAFTDHFSNQRTVSPDYLPSPTSRQIFRRPYMFDCWRSRCRKTTSTGSFFLPKKSWILVTKRLQLSHHPEIVVGTPGRLWSLLQCGNSYLADLTVFESFFLILSLPVLLTFRKTGS